MTSSSSSAAATTLPSCVASLQSSLDLLSSSIGTLDEGVHDFPRLGKVLQTTRHYELLPESTLVQAQAALLSSLTPELDGMLRRVDAYLDRLQRREAGLAARHELQEGRLASRRGVVDDDPPQEEATAQEGGGHQHAGEAVVDVQSGKEALRRQQIRKKKERLSYAVERLTLAAQQRERQLRQSVVAKGAGGEE